MIEDQFGCSTGEKRKILGHIWGRQPRDGTYEITASTEKSVKTRLSPKGKTSGEVWKERGEGTTEISLSPAPNLAIQDQSTGKESRSLGRMSEGKERAGRSRVGSGAKSTGAKTGQHWRTEKRTSFCQAPKYGCYYTKRKGGKKLRGLEYQRGGL